MEKTLLDSFSLEGRWSLLGKPFEEWIPGRLDFSPEDGLTLNTEAPVEKPKPGPVQSVNHESIVGLTQSAEVVTLIQCIGGMSGLNVSRGRVVLPGSYRAIFMIIGEHIESREVMKYRTVRARYHNFEDFIGVSGIRLENKQPQFRVTYEDRAPFGVRLNGFDCEIGNYGKYNIAYFESASVREQGRLDATAYEAEKHLEEFFSGPLASIHYLLQFSIGRRVPMIDLLAFTERMDREIGGRKFSPNVQIFFAQKRPLPLPPRRLPPALLFTIAALGPKHSENLERWHQGFGSFRDALDFYFSLDPVADTDVATQHHFLNAANAFEALHRVIGKKQTIETKEEYDKRIGDILKPFTGKLRQWLKGKLKHGNEVSLEDRLKELYECSPSEVKKLLGDRTFANKIATTRNALIHHSEELKQRAPLKSATDLWNATLQLRLLIELEFLRQMGIEESTLPQIVTRSSNFAISEAEFSRIRRVKLAFSKSLRGGSSTRQPRSE